MHHPSYAAPVVSHARSSPDGTNLIGFVNLAQTGAALLMITGMNFGPVDPSPTISVESVSVCASSTWMTSTSLSCRPATFSGGGTTRLLVAVASLAGSAMPGLFTFDGIRCRGLVARVYVLTACMRLDSVELT